jgi:hypothetical protein
MFELFSFYLQGGLIDVGFLGAAQIDPFGNINTTVIGPYDEPTTRLPGSGGACEIAINARQVFVIMRQSKRSFVESIDFRTSAGNLGGAEQSERIREQVSRGLIGIKPGWVRLSLPFYWSESDIEFALSAIEFVANHGRDFVPAYTLDWRDGVWRHRERPVPDVMPIELTVQALVEAAQSFAAGDHEAPISERELALERARYFEDAKRAVAECRARADREPIAWNPKTGDAAIDALAWFDYVHTVGL